MGSGYRSADVRKTAERLRSPQELSGILRNGKSTFAYSGSGACTVHLGPFPAEDPAL